MVYLFDLVTGTEYQITRPESNAALPAMSGDRVVWADLRNGNWDIYLYDLATGSERRITTQPAWQQYPALA